MGDASNEAFTKKREPDAYASDIAFTSAVKVIQSQKGSRKSYAKMEEHGGWRTEITPDLAGFIASLDMFYLGTANVFGQPYIQYRGGAKGFLKVLDTKTLGFADFRGNRQYITAGNLSENPQAFIFLMDYVNSRRVKLWGRARVVEGDTEILTQLQDAAYDGKVERAILFEVAAWDINCPQHIHKRWLQSDVASTVQRLQREVDELRAKLNASAVQE
jgi:predicted pyridoxine 5'-phosphate oxidase superfamily flavin-nucleotide-binding protein